MPTSTEIAASYLEASRPFLAFRNEEIMVFPGCPKIEFQTAVKKKGRKENKKRLTGWSIPSLSSVTFIFKDQRRSEMRVSAREMPPKSAISATRKVLKDATVKLQLVAILRLNGANVIGFAHSG